MSNTTHAPAETAIALIPERDRPDGPVTTRRLRRTVAVYGALAAAGTAIAITAGRRPIANMGVGLIAPGAGYLSAGKPLSYALTQPAFLASLGLWLGSGNVLAPLTIWGGTAAASSRHGVRWRAARAVVPGAAAAALTAALRIRERGFRQAVKRRDQRNAHLRELGATTAQPASPARPVSAASPEVGELSADQLALQRYILDRSLQPVGEFAGFDRIEQFQTSSIRYQVTCAGLALAAAQYDYTPAFSGYVNVAQQNLIAKWQERVCWAYWAKESMWGHLRYNPNPVPKDNIMLTGWLGYQLASYMSNTHDARYLSKGSVTFAHPRGRRFEYDFGSITEALLLNFQRSEFTLYPCEPNWIYALCNGFGILPLPIHDRLYGTDYTERILPSFRRGFENEFLSADGRTIGIRSAWTGLTVPAMTSVISDASVIWQLAPLVPDIARRQYEILRHEWVRLNSDGTLSLDLSGWDKIDTGNYRRSNISALLWMRAAAAELGDSEVAAAAQLSIDQEAPPTVEDGVRYHPGVSAQGTCGLFLASTARKDSHFNRVNRGMPEQWLNGPILADADYPEVLVARAVTDGAALDLVLRPGADMARQTLTIGRLRAGQRYRTPGAVDAEVTADAHGNAYVQVDLEDRHEVRIVPANQNGLG
ncbi:MAG: hypothetical protein QOH91_2214 [Mycobacterium sp.]|nr:hypothetical protein [Mycobacterium sp.]